MLTFYREKVIMPELLVDISFDFIMVACSQFLLSAHALAPDISYLSNQ